MSDIITNKFIVAGTKHTLKVLMLFEKISKFNIFMTFIKLEDLLLFSLSWLIL